MPALQQSWHPRLFSFLNLSAEDSGLVMWRGPYLSQDMGVNLSSALQEPPFRLVCL
jgi:hypothetical protein